MGNKYFPNLFPKNNENWQIYILPSNPECPLPICKMIALPAAAASYYSNYNFCTHNPNISSHRKYIQPFISNVVKSTSTFHRHHQHHQLNAVVLGQAPVAEEDDLVSPSQHFSSQALVPSFQKVSLTYPSIYSFLYISIYLLYDHVPLKAIAPV